MFERGFRVWLYAPVPEASVPIDVKTETLQAIGFPSDTDMEVIAEAIRDQARIWSSDSGITVTRIEAYEPREL